MLNTFSSTNIQHFKTTLYKTQKCDVRFMGPLMDSRIW
jgi:hypothetical protein